jgi:hypothetical protein
MAPSLIQQAGAQPKSQSRFASIHTSKALHGEISNRFALQDPSQFIVEKFYGGYQDCLLLGSNVEVGPRNTWVGRPGSTLYSTFQFPTSPLGAFSFNQNGVFTLYVDTTTNIYSVTPTSGTNVFTKGTSLTYGPALTGIPGQASYLQLGASLFIADGVDTVKIISGGNNNPIVGQPIWNWGIVGPTTAPIVNIVESGSAAVPWTPNTYYTTLGLIVDLNGNVQQLVSVNANATNPNAIIGKSGNGGPAWNLTPGTVTSEGSASWTNKGPIAAWKANTVINNATVGGTLANPCIVYDPVSQACYIQANAGNAQGTTGTSKPAFTGAVASIFHDGSVKWFCLGTPKAPPLWAASTHYQDVSNNDGAGATVYPVTCAAAGIGGNNPQQIFWFDAGATGGTSGTGGTAPFQTGQAKGTLTSDNQLQWLNLGSATWAANTPYSAWGQGSNFIFSVIKDSNGNLQVCTTTGISGSTQPTWATLYGQTTPDGTGANAATWTCVGTSLSWAANTNWFLPTTGFIVPATTDPYGGSEVIDSHANVEICTNSGLSGSSAPTWATTTGSQTTEAGSTLTWIMTAPYSQPSLAWSHGYAWGYAFKARTATDYYVLNIPNGRTVSNGPPTGSGDGSISTCSPIFKLAAGPNAGAVVTLTGQGSLDPQVDTIVIFRCADGFMGGPYLEETEIPAPAPVNGQPGTWTFQDTIPDTLLNPLVTADTVGLNNPPPTGITNLVYHQGRVFASVSNIVYASSGPDIPPDNGNGLTSWGAANNFPLTSPVSKLLAPITGLLAFTLTDEWTIAGGPAISQYFPSITRAGVGLLTPNAICSLGAEIVIFTADRRLLAMIPGAGETNMGWNVQDQLQTYNPAAVYATLHESGIDQSAIFVGNGSTTYKRCVPHSQPNNDIVWSPTATVTATLPPTPVILTPNNIQNAVWNLPTPSVTITPTLLRGGGINVGDTAILLVSFQNQTADSKVISATSITDNLGNVWKPLFPLQTPVTGVNPFSFQAWYATMLTAVPVASSLVISATINNVASGSSGEASVVGFANFAGLGPVDQIQQASGSTALPSSGSGITITQPAYTFSFVWDWGGTGVPNMVPHAGWTVNPTFGDTNAPIQYTGSWNPTVQPIGTYQDTWQDGNAANTWSDTMVTFLPYGQEKLATCTMLQSIQTAPGVRSLLIGSQILNGNWTLMQRDITSNTDNGIPFAQSFIISPGPITRDGEMAELGFITSTGARTGSAPTVSYLLDEISGTYQQFASYVSDPPLLYGASGQPNTLYRNRYYFKQSMSDGNPPQEGLWCTDILLQFAWPAENAAHEVARFTLFAGIYRDPSE